MKISVVIPLYNAENTIKNTINSVLDQSYNQAIEVIIVNDGSTDRSVEIVEKLIVNNRTNRIIRLINKNNGGVSSARNLGVTTAKGDFIAFLDSDDIWHPKKLEIILALINENDINFIGHSHTINKSFPKLKTHVTLERISFYKLLFKNFAVTPSIIVKKDICEKFNERMTHTEDHELWLRLALKNEVYYLDLPLVRLGRPQLSEGGLSSDIWKMRKGEIQMFFNIAKRKKALIPSLPFLISFSLSKHLRKIIFNFIKPLDKECR